MRVIARIDKGGTEQIRVVLHEWREQVYCDIRLWYEKDNGFHPTTKGLRFSAELLPGLRAAIDAAIRTIEAGEDIGDSREVKT